MQPDQLLDRVALDRELGLDPVVEIDGVPGMRHPVGFSVTPPRYRLRPPAQGAHGGEIRARLAE